jgi:hypothetical protein
MDKYTDVSAEIHQLATDIYDFCCDFGPYEEYCFGNISEKDVNEHIMYIAKEVYGKAEKTIETLQEAAICSPELAEQAESLICRINEVRSKTNTDTKKTRLLNTAEKNK